ncbi:glycoside hydrolase family 3 C-terminal domain-containing protein [Aquimarina sp. D1M17]|uniref:glycoside hydrolase family 3 N-terminal domain-containing protein n=1 Tax=Aquimarina acroporae TaxID=2937283 RepID=UPI0020C0DF8C|nr:glycoside hydrolase family 3 N-terminal domain-containing protein [Aquimarina acroporae]MCK8520800.1 glycoside hydrolase family 3 C-terminal domain-containing protein [Aquimarina acroporae]
MRTNTLLVMLLGVLFFSSCSFKEKESKASDPIDEKVAELLSKMTLEEKIGQMTQITVTALEKEGSPGEFDKEKLKEAIHKYKIGSILNVPNPGAPTPKRWNEVLNEILQETNATDKKIPIIYGIDAIHGSSYTDGAVLFPQQIGMAATWDPELVEKCTAVSAYETRASSIPWVFSPDLDLPRHPAWSRLWESFGEDTYLSSQMGVAMVNGFQGEDIGKSDRVAACIKHYIGYGSTTTGKDRTPSIIPERVLRQYDLPIYQKSIEAGAKSVMISSGEVNGTPVHASKKLITDILKDELNFKGIVVTDWQDIIYLHTRHKVASTMREAVKKSVLAGIDMSMVPDNYTFFEELFSLVSDGEVPMSRIDDAVSRILRVKFELDLFRTPVTNPEDYPDFGSSSSVALSYIAASESITLLKNTDNILPLSKEKKVLVTGPTANSMKYLNGGWSYTWQGEKSDEYAKDKLTILEAFEAKVGKQNVLYSPGVSIFEEIDIANAVSQARNVDYILLCLGEHNYTETPGDINSLILTKPQIKLAKALSELNKPIVLILNEGRPRIISGFEKNMNAVVQCYLPGNEGARALVDIVYGDVNPSGKLPYNYPRYDNSLQKYNRKYTESLGDEEQNDDADYQRSYSPQYEFGYGLSYTTFEYKNLSVDKVFIDRGDEVNVSIDVQNTGEITGKEVVQLYVRDLFASITPEYKSLKRFKKIELKPGEVKTISFTIQEEDLKFVNENNEWIAESGEFEIMIGELVKKIVLEKEL